MKPKDKLIKKGDQKIAISADRLIQLLAVIASVTHIVKGSETPKEAFDWLRPMLQEFCSDLDVSDYSPERALSGTCDMQITDIDPKKALVTVMTAALKLLNEDRKSEATRRFWGS